MVKEYLLEHLADPPSGIAQAPNKFLNLTELIDILDTLNIKSIIYTGQEPSLDPAYQLITKTVHQRYKCQNTLYTNLYTMPPLKDTDRVEFGMKALTNSIHMAYTGKSNITILDNFVKLYQSKTNIIIEAVLIPGLINADEIERMAKYISVLSKEIPFIILPYFKSGDNPWHRPSATEMDDAVQMASKHLKNVHCFYGNEKLSYEVKSIFPAIIDTQCWPVSSHCLHGTS